MEQFDVAIIGGGPAGSAAGHAAASNGASAIVIEKGVPRDDRNGQMGPDSTDAAGILDYWVDIMGIHPDEMPEGVILDTLDRAEFIGPTESLTMESTGINSSYDQFGFCMHRAKFDDFLRSRAESAGASYRIGTSVRSVDTESPTAHQVRLADGSELHAKTVILADGPQRQLTNRVLDTFLSFEVTDRLSTRKANHIAYQEHRRLPDAVAAEIDGAIKFWWGHMPGHTAYPWIFPNDDNIARIGLTMPIGLSLEDISSPSDYPLLSADDTQLPRGSEYIRRLLEQEYGDEYDVSNDFPVVTDRGKKDGTETYAISSTRPIESPTQAGIAVVGGAMGATSAFHEGGDHTAIRTGNIAGELAANGNIANYNNRWKNEIGDEVLRNAAMADTVRSYRPDDWDHAFATARSLISDTGGLEMFKLSNIRAGMNATKLLGAYKMAKFRFRNGQYVQLTESEYAF